MIVKPSLDQQSFRQHSTVPGKLGQVTSIDDLRLRVMQFVESMTS